MSYTVKSFSKQEIGGEHLEEFEILLKPWRGALERFVHFKVSIKADAEDILQEIYCIPQSRILKKIIPTRKRGSL